ncbi:hypothetical protein ECJB195_A0024 [Escherichia coli JB1-95]|nr:hypothetical protein ECJB195_A0024 [Escherichia coli JB1-95]
MRSASFRASLRNSGECYLRGFLLVGTAFLSYEPPLTESLLT